MDFGTFVASAGAEFIRSKDNWNNSGLLLFPAAKVTCIGFINPVVAVLLGIFLLDERPDPAEFAGMAGIVVAVFLLTTAQVKAKGKPLPVEELEQAPVD
jgi:hypothetical protein